MNIFYSMQRNIKLRNKSQHHITILTLLFWVRKPPKKPKMEKPMQQSDIDFIMRKYGTLQSLQIHPNLVNATTRQKHWTNPQLNLNTPLQECTTQLYGLTRADSYDRMAAIRNLYGLTSSCTKPVRNSTTFLL